jgi:metal-dependent hydrolase (beta-lactamase superfamily II)
MPLRTADRVEIQVLVDNVTDSLSTTPPFVTREWVALRRRGMQVFSACSHAGIVNLLHHARACFPGEPIFAAMGGFHLSGENEAIIPETVRDLVQSGLAHLFPAHCTGWRAANALERAFGEPAVVPAAVGKVFSIWRGSRTGMSAIRSGGGLLTGGALFSRR